MERNLMIDSYQLRLGCSGYNFDSKPGLIKHV